MLFYHLLLLATTATAAATAYTFSSSEKKTRCHVSGACYGITVGIPSPSHSYNHCLSQCKNNSNACLWVTFYESSKQCIQMSSCPKVESCNDLHSGMEMCPFQESKHEVTGICNGHFVASNVTASARKCLDYCKSVPECKWFSYSTKFKTCLLTRDCQKLDDSCTDCVAGERDCHIVSGPGRKLFVMGGGIKSAEIIDLSGRSLSCPKLTDLPVPLTGSVGVFLDNRVLLCGGNNGLRVVNNCLKYEGDEWLATDPMLVERERAATVMLSPTEWWITGGYNNNNTGNTDMTEVFTVGQGFSKYVNLPEAIAGHKLFKINATHIMLIKGADGGNHSSWMFNTETESWSRLPDAPYFMRGCSVALINLVNFDGIGNGVLVVCESYFSGGSSNLVKIFNLNSLSWMKLEEITSTMKMQVRDLPEMVRVNGNQIQQLRLHLRPRKESSAEWVPLPYRLSETMSIAPSVMFFVSDDFISCI